MALWGAGGGALTLLRVTLHLLGLAGSNNPLAAPWLSESREDSVPLPRTSEDHAPRLPRSYLQEITLPPIAGNCGKGDMSQDLHKDGDN